MLAIVAAIVFLLSLIFDWAGVHAGDILTSGTLVTIGLLILALHLAGFGPSSAKVTEGAGPRRWWRR